MAEPDDAVPEVKLFTDGACAGNPGPGGYGVVLRTGRHRKELCGAYQETTNNRMELMAAIVGLQALRRPCRVMLTTDSEYLGDAVRKGWAERWRQNGWWRSANERAANADLWAILLDLLSQHHVTVVWTRGHAGHTENECCDRLARGAIGACVAALDQGYEQSKAGGPRSIPEGHPCFKCRTPVVKRRPKKRKVERHYTYHWYLHCPGCGAMYMVDEGKRHVVAPVSDALFEASAENTGDES